jgi:radical SAM protein with 4Fe4S-binding SPASM domain
MTKYTHNLKNQFDELNRQLGTRGIIRKFSPIGRGKINKDMLKDEETSHDNSGDNMVNLTTSLNSIKTCRCGALNKTLYINYEGNIYPCGLLEKSEYYLENIKNIENLSDFFSSNKFKTCEGYISYLALQPENHPRCKDCNVNQFCWNCIHFLDLVSKNDNFFNRACPIIKKNLQKLIWSERR